MTISDQQETVRLEFSPDMLAEDRAALAAAYTGIEAHWPRIVAQQEDIAGDMAHIPAGIVVNHARYALTRAALEPSLDRAVARLVDGSIAHDITTGADLAQTPAEAACGEGCFFCCVLVDRISATRAEIARVSAAIDGLPAPDFHPDACPALDPVTKGCRAHAVRPLVCRDVYANERQPCETSFAEGRIRPEVTFMHAGAMMLFYGINWLLITLGSDRMLEVYDLKASLRAGGTPIPLP